MSKILILGGHGFIGCHTSHILKQKKHEVGIIDCYHQYYTFPDWEYQPVLAQRKEWANEDRAFIGRIEDEKFMANAFQKFNPDIVIHLATYPNAQMVKRNAIDATNNMITSLVTVLNLCVKHSVKRIVFSSSSMVYGDFQTDAPDEDHPTNPLTLYGSYKLQGEKMCKIWQREFGLEYAIMRPSALYGTRDMIVRVISQMAKNCLTQDKIIVNGPENKLDFSFVEDVADSFTKAALDKNATNQIFNCTRGKGRHIIEAAEMIKQIIGKGNIEVRPHDTFYPNRDTLNSAKIKFLINWTPKFDIEQGIPKYLTWLLKQKFLNKL